MVSLVELDRGGPVVATVGLTTDEATSQSGGISPDWSRTRAAIVSYLYPGQSAPSDPSAAVSPCPCEARPTRRSAPCGCSGEPPTATRPRTQVALLEELAVRAGPAIENARRFHEARQLADLDALTGLHNYRYFHETLAREVARAHRYERKLALVVFDIDDFKAVNDRIGHLAGDSVLAEAAERVRSVVRGADIACRIGGDEFAVVLPESTVADAENLYRRLQAALNNWRSGDQQLRLSAGMAELEPGDDGALFFKRADAALYKAKDSGKGQAIAATAEA